MYQSINFPKPLQIGQIGRNFKSTSSMEPGHFCKLSRQIGSCQANFASSAGRQAPVRPFLQAFQVDRLQLGHFCECSKQIGSNQAIFGVHNVNRLFLQCPSIVLYRSVVLQHRQRLRFYYLVNLGKYAARMLRNGASRWEKRSRKIIEYIGELRIAQTNQEIIPHSIKDQPAEALSAGLFMLIFTSLLMIHFDSKICMTKVRQ